MPPGFDRQQAVASSGPAEIAAALQQLMKSIEGTNAASMLAMLMSAAAARTVAPSDAEIMQRSRELIDAVDRGDVAVVDAALAHGFVQFEGGPASDRQALLATTQHRSRIAQRTWDSESVARNDGVLVYMGRAHETQRGNEVHDGYLCVGWFLLQWVRAGNDWRVQLWTWQKETNERDVWNEVFRHRRGFSPEPNCLLVETIRGKRSGAALDLAMGQGRNALYLASQGWTVTGVDGSDEGVRIACDQAAKCNLPLEGINANIDEWDFGTDRFDLVTLMYAGDHAQWMDKIKTSLRTGGLLVVEGWAKAAPDSAIGFSDGQLADLFDGYEILRDEIVEDVPDWVHARGRLVRFVARKK